jgi:hypothetical protein
MILYYTNKGVDMHLLDQAKIDAYKDIECACGCGRTLKEKDRFGRPHTYISGHNGRKYDDPKQYKREWNKRNKPYRKRVKGERYRRLKVKAMMLKGGKCNICHIEYDGKNAPIYEFHHRDPNMKEYQITHMLVNKAWATLLIELEKCDLLCSNCHNQIHSVDF